MVEVVEVKSYKYGVVMRMSNGTVLTICPHEYYVYFTLSGIELPTHINSNPQHLSNNTLSWNYHATECKE